MRLRGVLLDLDDTLLDHHGAVGEALTSWLPTLGVPVTPATRALWDDLTETHLQAWRERRITYREQRRRRLRDFLPAVGLRYAESDLDTIFEGFLHAYESAWRPFSDVPAALAAVTAAGLRVAVLTNGTTAQQNHKLRRTGLAGLVGPVWTVDELGVAKPDPEVFRRACARWELPPATVLSVGDNYELDVVAARVAGLQAAHLDRRDRGPHGERVRLTSLLDLPTLFH